jgi:glyceraldehyde-3-phosphate dehydrogenase/erythrose-4-phosphate dehydrogenase
MGSGPANARDLWLVHNDDEVASWYDNERGYSNRLVDIVEFTGSKIAARK